MRSLEELKDKTECELNRILLAASLSSASQRTEDLRRLRNNLKKYTDVLVYGNRVYGPSQDPASLQLHWDSWDHMPVPQHTYSR